MPDVIFSIEVEIKIISRVQSPAASDDFVVQMRSGASSRIAEFPDKFACSYLLPYLNIYGREVCIECLQVVCVSDNDGSAVRLSPAGKFHNAGSRTSDGVADSPSEIHARMKFETAPCKRIAAVTKR